MFARNISSKYAKTTLCTERKIHLAGLVAWDMRLKRRRPVCKSQYVCPYIDLNEPEKKYN